MKYQKPTCHDLSELSFADGACASGAFVGTCIPNGLQAGSCESSGFTAAVCVSNGATVGETCATNGTVGYGINCQPTGGIATTVP